jgi:hypothetical protein
MRCIVCNAALSDYESTVRHAITGKFLDICQNCLQSMDVDIPIFDRKDLLHEADIPTLEDLADDYDDLGDFEHYDE